MKAALHSYFLVATDSKSSGDDCTVEKHGSFFLVGGGGGGGRVREGGREGVGWGGG